jgi:hypothetical protein
MTDFIHHPKNPPPRSALDAVLRRFARLSYYAFIAGVFAVGATALAIALVPALWVVERAIAWSAPLDAWARRGILAAAIAASFFVFGFALLVVVPIFNFVLPTRVKPFKGGYYTIHAVPWALHNALFYVVRYTFLKWVTLTPPGIWFLRAMGMKIGRHAFVNTDLLSDPSLLTLGDDGFFVFAVATDQLAEAHQLGVKLVATDVAGTEIASVDIPPTDFSNPAKQDARQPIFVSTISTQNDLTKVLGVEGSVNIPGAVSLELRYPDGTTVNIPLSGDGHYLYNVPEQRTGDLFDTPGWLIARDGSGIELARTPVAAVAYWRSANP